jgi:peptide deformylase
MIKELIKYPQTLSKEFNAPVRFFNDELKELISNLKDTIKEHNLEGLSAYQINNPYNVVVVKKDDDFMVLVNPKIYQNSGSISTKETTTYFGDISAELTRYAEIKIVYEDEDGNTKYITAKDDFAVLLQRKIDYTFGGTIRYRLDDKKQDEFDMKLEFGNDALDNANCTISTFKDKISNTINYITAFSFISLFLVFFLDDKNLIILNDVQNYTMISILILIFVYIPYGYYEGQQNKGCTSCQIGNILGTAFIAFIKLTILFVINYFIF